MTIRVLVDMSGGLVTKVEATEPVEVVFVDYDDPGNDNAEVPRRNGEMAPCWASVVEAQVDPDRVNKVSEGLVWADQEDDGSSAAEPA